MLSLKKILFIQTSVFLAVGFTGYYYIKSIPKPLGPSDSTEVLAASTRRRFQDTAPTPSNFSDSFTVPGTLDETGSMSESTDTNWWLNSGGQFLKTNGIGMTMAGDQPAYSRWAIAYRLSNPVDTDNGSHPQNIFRLVTKSKWGNYIQQVYFRITADNLSDSPARNETNGIHLFNRYADGNNLYYVGVRADGLLAIKKKIGGTYYTMATKKYFAGTYDHSTSPNLLPKNTWYGLMSMVNTNADGSVTIKMLLDPNRSGNWVLVLSVTDSGSKYGSAPLLAKGFAGIRTDFMDVQFDDYQISEVK